MSLKHLCCRFSYNSSQVEGIYDAKRAEELEGWLSTYHGGIYKVCWQQKIFFISQSNPPRCIKNSGCCLTLLQRAQDQVKLDGPTNQSKHMERQTAGIQRMNRKRSVHVIVKTALAGITS